MLRPSFCISSSFCTWLNPAESVDSVDAIVLIMIEQALIIIVSIVDIIAVVALVPVIVPALHDVVVMCIAACVCVRPSPWQFCVCFTGK